MVLCHGGPAPFTPSKKAGKRQNIPGISAPGRRRRSHTPPHQNSEKTEIFGTQTGGPKRPLAIKKVSLFRLFFDPDDTNYFEDNSMQPTTTTERSKATAGRMFRRFRAQFKKDLANAQIPTGAKRVLIDQAALLALRAQQMRDAILTGEKAVSDEDLVRCSNASIRVMAAIERRKDRAVSNGKPQTFEDRMKAREQTARREFDENDF